MWCADFLWAEHDEHDKVLWKNVDNRMSPETCRER